jgi:hypothetical protein
LTITKGGNGEGVYVNKTSGSGNAVTIIGDLEATNIKRTGGTSSQFLKANGSIDSTSYQPTLVSATNIKTVNGNSLLGSGDLVVGGGITVGTTAVTSGTVGRIFFQGTGDVVQQSGSLFWDNTNSRLGVGATPATSVRLDVRAQGTLSTDIAFRVRNSADTGNALSVDGTSNVIVPVHLQVGSFKNPNSILTVNANIAGTMAYFGGGSSSSNLIYGYQNSILTNNSTGASFQVRIGGGTALNNTHIAIQTGSDSGNVNCNSIGINATAGSVGKNIAGRFSATGGASNTAIKIDNGDFVMLNNSVVKAYYADSFNMYSDDIAAGNAAPHFRTENGDIIKLYKQSSAGILTVPQLVTVLQNLGLLS